MRTVTTPWRVIQRPVILGSVAAGLATVCYGSTHFLARKLVMEQGSPLVVATIGLLVGTLIFLAVSSRGVVQDRSAPRRAFLLMALAGLTSSTGVVFAFSALSLAPVVVVSPVVAVNPLISLGLGHRFLHRVEKVTLRIWMGAALVVAGVIFIALDSG